MIPASGAGGPGFKSRLSPNNFADLIMQMFEGFLPDFRRANCQMFYQLLKNLRSTWYLSGARESLRIELLEASRPIFRISQPGSLYVCTFVCHFVKEKRNNERERQRGSDRAFQHFGLSFYQKCWIDLDRTRTCNPQIRSLVPYPLGHKVLRWLELKTW